MEDMAKFVFLHQLSLLAVTMLEELSLWLDPQWFFVELKQLKQGRQSMVALSETTRADAHPLPILHSQEGEKDRSHSGG